MTSESIVLGAMITPALWFAGLGAVAAPILIHLLARRRFRRVRWAAMEFLLEAQRRNRRRLRMEEWILLAMRCTAVAILGAMLARPFLQPSSAAASLAGSKRSERLFLIDDSLSMAWTGAGVSPLDEAREAVRRVVEAVRRDAPDDTVTVARLTAADDPVAAGTFLTESQTADLLSRVEAIGPTMMSFDPAVGVATAAKLLERNPGVTNAVVHIISDFQASQWQRGSGAASGSGGGAGERGLLAPLSDWAKEGRGLRVVLVDLGQEGRSNLAVTSLPAPRGNVVAGAAAALDVALLNDSDAELRDVELSLSLEQVQQAARRVEAIGARQSVQASLEVEFPRAGWEHVRVESPGDGLPADNVRHLALEVLSALRILVVNGEPSPDAITDETAFLGTALRPEGELFSGNELSIIDESQLAEAKLEEFHLVVIANVFGFGEPVVEGLEAYVRTGGGLLVFLGDQVDADAYNATLFRGEGGLLPGRLGDIQAPSEPVRLVVDDRLHPAVSRVARDGDPLGLGQIPFERYFSFTLSEVAPVGADAAFAPGSIAGAATAEGEGRLPHGRTRVVAHFNDAVESPAIVERSHGDGRVMLVTTSADKEWNLWPDHPTYLPVLMELCHHMARSGSRTLDVRVGQPLEIRVDVRRFEPNVRVRTPGFPGEPETVVTATVPEEGQGASVRWSGTDAAGLYQFELRGRDGADESRWATVNVDPAESRLSSCSDTELRRAMGDTPYEHVKGLAALSSAAGDARTEVWRLLLIAAALLLIGEQGLAWWWGRRR